PPPSPSVLTKDNIVVEGGVRVRNITVMSVSASGNVLTVVVNTAGDYSTYVLRLVQSPTVTNVPPANFDPQLSTVDFSFKAGCPSPFDCATVSTCPQPTLPAPDINYLAKDYASFRRLMLDRMSVLMPQWTERHAADLEVTLVELLAYTADHLSYFQDAVSSEAYLGTARRRISVRRHARLLNYFLNDGCNARAWVHVEITAGSAADGATLPKGTKLLTRGSSDQVTVTSSHLLDALAEQPTVFETMHDLALFAGNDFISFYTWSDSECCLPKGATVGTLRAPSGAPPISLSIGDRLLFEETVGPETGNPADADPKHRAVVQLTSVTNSTDPLDGTPVTEIEWRAVDALPFPLCLTALVSIAGGPPQMIEVSVARGNIALSDHGLTIVNEPLVPVMVPEKGIYQPILQHANVTFQVPYTDQSTTEQDPHAAVPVVSLSDGQQQWNVQRDLLESSRFATEFVVETERDGSAHLRFGDGILGAAPVPGTNFTAAYRVGNGTAGNIGAEALRRVAWDTAGITLVRNPLPASGGTDPESLDQARQFAPQQFRIQQRAVTAADYASIAERHPEVRKAAARFRWTGSWYTVFVTVERTGGQDVDTDPVFKQDMENWIGEFRMAGYDIEINGPIYVPLDIVLDVCIEGGYFQADVLQRLLNAFSSGSSGFFYPDNFTFGQPVYLSQIYQRAMQVDGVASVNAETFQRFGRPADQELQNGVILMSPLEVARLSNDRNFPENGQIQFLMGGGL
ncbi:MAG: putative baseplate assembly protein, partial [Acidobacteriaceae bacterium]|nr:putative baseplate assembly protein [Acidobacteriaceae bacterium]